MSNSRTLRSRSRRSVEHILGIRTRRGECEYLVQWDREDERSWVPGKYLDCPELIAEYESLRAKSKADENRTTKRRRMDDIDFETTTKKTRTRSNNPKRKVISPKKLNPRKALGDLREDGRTEINKPKRKLGSPIATSTRRFIFDYLSPLSSSSSFLSPPRLSPRNSRRLRFVSRCRDDETTQFARFPRKLKYENEFNVMKKKRKLAHQGPSPLFPTSSANFRREQCPIASSTRNDELRGKSRKFSRQLAPSVQILGIGRENGVRYFWMQRAGADSVEKVPAVEVNKRYPQLVLDFYQEQIRWV